jgi:hypothetical protein
LCHVVAGDAHNMLAAMTRNSLQRYKQVDTSTHPVSQTSPHLCPWTPLRHDTSLHTAEVLGGVRIITPLGLHCSLLGREFHSCSTFYPFLGTTFFSLASILPSFVLVCAGSHARATRVCVDHERLATLDGPHQLVSSPCERRVCKPLPSVCADIAATACRSLQHSEAQHASHHPDQVRQQDALRHRHGVEWWHNDRNRGARVE